ncbi:MAG: radical SAM protein [Candidatus Eisenbacteria sp.]|nr:radical SAM protein [Candidatus Eisenbacteria bacterium]
MRLSSVAHSIRTAARLAARGQLDQVVYQGIVACSLPLFAPRFPRILTIEPTNRCNLRCPICPTGSGRLRREMHDMSFSDFRRLVEEASGRTRMILLHFCGEPFLCDNIIPMVELATRKGIAVELSTNGMFLESMTFCRQLVRSGLRHLVVALDGADQETLVVYRRGACFQSIVDGIAHLREARDAEASPMPTIELQLILMKHNEHQRQEMRLLARQLRVDRYTEKTLGMMGLSLSSPEGERLARAFLPASDRDSRFSYGSERVVRMEPSRRFRCRSIHEVGVILSNGIMVPCCYDPHGLYPMGNALTEGIASVWRGRRFREFRRQVHRPSSRPLMCAACSESRADLNLPSTELQSGVG